MFLNYNLVNNAIFNNKQLENI